jgi:predicted ribosome quality control (RQC) complex YloA/Tae2 family protein
MDYELDCSKSARANLQDVYAKLRVLKDKRKGIVVAMEETKKQIQIHKKKGSDKKVQSSKKGIKKNKKKHWYHSYHTFKTSNEFRVVAGKSAKENDELYAKQLKENDLFFHADIQGAPTVILKNGLNAQKQDLIEAAQWAASFSSAFKTGVAAVDTYAVEKEQVSKHAQGGFIGRGAFAITGERKWFRKTELRLKIGLEDDELIVIPALKPQKLEREVFIAPGGMEKEVACKRLSAHLSAKADYIASLLPSGKMNISI